MGQVPYRTGAGPFLERFQISLNKTLIFGVEGYVHKAEADVGYPESFEITEIKSINDLDILDLLDWADGQKGHALRELERLCLEEINNQT